MADDVPLETGHLHESGVEDSAIDVVHAQRRVQQGDGRAVLDIRSGCTGADRDARRVVHRHDVDDRRGRRLAAATVGDRVVERGLRFAVGIGRERHDPVGDRRRPAVDGIDGRNRERIPVAVRRSVGKVAHHDRDRCILDRHERLQNRRVRKVVHLRDLDPQHDRIGSGLAVRRADLRGARKNGRCVGNRTEGESPDRGLELRRGCDAGQRHDQRPVRNERRGRVQRDARHGRRHLDDVARIGLRDRDLDPRDGRAVDVGQREARDERDRRIAFGVAHRLHRGTVRVRDHRPVVDGRHVDRDGLRVGFTGRVPDGVVEACRPGRVRIRRECDVPGRIDGNGAADRVEHLHEGGRFAIGIVVVAREDGGRNLQSAVFQDVEGGVGDRDRRVVGRRDVHPHGRDVRRKPAVADLEHDLALRFDGRLARVAEPDARQPVAVVLDVRDPGQRHRLGTGGGKRTIGAQLDRRVRGKRAVFEDVARLAVGERHDGDAELRVVDVRNREVGREQGRRRSVLRERDRRFALDRHRRAVHVQNRRIVHRAHVDSDVDDHVRRFAVGDGVAQGGRTVRVRGRGEHDLAADDVRRPARDIDQPGKGRVRPVGIRVVGQENGDREPQLLVLVHGVGTVVSADRGVVGRRDRQNVAHRRG